MRQGTERLLKGLHSLAVGRSCQGFLPRLPEVQQGFIPHLTPQGVMGQVFDLLGHPFPGERLQSLDDAGMERAPPFLEQRFVGHLLGEDMLEGVRVLGELTRLIEELGRLQGDHTVAQLSLRQLHDGLQ